jgi:hypothetical protein
MALLITSTGEEREVKGASKGGKFELPQLYRLIDTDMVQCVPVKITHQNVNYNEAWCDEEGKLKNKPVNDKASQLVGNQLIEGDCFVGNVLFMRTRKEGGSR